jgi:hypothetical protein
MLLAALPNYAGQPLVPPSKDPVQFVQQLHSHILSAVLPLWSHPKAAHAPAGVLTAMIRVLQTCAAGPSHASLVLRYQQQGRPVQRVQPQPDAAMVQTITEMGFSQARAEEALRRVGANSVELAMEWLISHPEEPAAPAAAGGAAAGAAGGGAAAAGPAAAVVDEEEELTRALLASLSVVGMSPDTVAQRSQQQQQQQQQREQEQEEESRPPLPAADAADGSPTAAQQATFVEQVTTPQATQRPLVQPGAPIARAAAAAATAGVPASDQTADPATSAGTGIPAPAQLVDGAVRLVAASPSTAFSIADLLLTIAQREEGKGREALVGRLVDACLPLAPAADPAAASSSSAAAAAAAFPPPSGDILTPARLLLLLLTKDGSSRKVAAKLGLVARCLLQLEQWQLGYKADVEAFERSAAQQGQSTEAAAAIKRLEVPVWVEASLMLLDVMVTTTMRTTNPAAAAAARVAAARAAVAAAAEAIPRPAAAAAAAPEAAAGDAAAAAAASAGGDVQMADQPGAAAVDGSPAAVNASEEASTPQTTPRPVVQPGAPTLGVAPAAAAVGTAVLDTPVAATAGEAVPDAASIKLPAELSQLSGLSGVLASWRPCGLLDEQQQRAATSLCLALLQQLHDHADKWEQPATSMFEADGSLPNPSSVTQALLQLLAHLTKRHSNAQQVSNSRAGQARCACFGVTGCCCVMLLACGMRMRLVGKCFLVLMHAAQCFSDLLQGQLCSQHQHTDWAVLPVVAQVLSAGGHRLLLSLPSACLSPAISRHEGSIGAILRHLLEDPATLEGWMEAEIKNIMAVKGAMRDPYTGRAYPYNQANPSSRCAPMVDGAEVGHGASMAGCCSCLLPMMRVACPLASKQTCRAVAVIMIMACKASEQHAA